MISFIIKDAHQEWPQGEPCQWRSGRVLNEELPCPLPVTQDTSPCWHITVLTNLSIQCFYWGLIMWND